MQVEGRCHCGQVAYEAEIDPGQVVICHCTDCQTLSGSAFRTVVQTRPGAFRLRSGQLKTYVKVAESGARRVQGFCPECGTPVYSTADGPEPRTYGLRVGTLAQRAALRPVAQIWSASALPWLAEVPGLPGRTKGPGSAPIGTR
jgi:hypothetical protein